MKLKGKLRVSKSGRNGEDQRLDVPIIRSMPIQENRPLLHILSIYGCLYKDEYLRVMCSINDVLLYM